MPDATPHQPLDGMSHQHGAIRTESGSIAQAKAANGVGALHLVRLQDVAPMGACEGGGEATLPMLQAHRQAGNRSAHRAGGTDAETMV